MKKIFLNFILAFFSMFFISTFADSTYLEAKDYKNLSLQEFIDTCKLKNKNAYFNKNVYRLTSNLYLPDGVDILGEEGTIFESDGIQKYIFDKEKVSVKNITIEHILFDNVSIWCQNSGSTGWTIKNNIFTNAKDLDTTIACKPDSNNKNGGSATGYYIQNKRGSMNILSNMFLRNSSSLGRGVATYFTKGVVIKDNYFGRLEDVEGSIVSSETKHLKEVALASGRVNLQDDYGYFMTGINILNSDVNTKIIGNHLSFNTHITEAGYEDGSQSTNGYNRDHIVYAKAFQNLEIVGNYFKGMNKNQDGGIKCRNGEGLLIYKNIVEDSLILLYVQDDATGALLKHVDIRENIFINKVFTTEKIEIPYGNSGEKLTKYLTIDYSILFLNYKAQSDVDFITISSNLFYSNGLANEQIRIDNRDKAYDVPKNIYIENNKNLVGAYTRVTTRNFKNEENVDVASDWNNGVEYKAILEEDYEQLDVHNLVNLQEVPYEIIDGRLITSATKAYVDGIEYANETLRIGSKYSLFLLLPVTTSIVIEKDIKEDIPSFKYTILEIEVKEKGFRVSFVNNGHGQVPIELKDCLVLPKLPLLEEKGFTFLGWYTNEELTDKVKDGISLSSNITLYAKWIKCSYTITYDSQGHGIKPESIEVLDKLPILLPNLTEEGWKFGGWYLDATCQTKAIPGSDIKDSITLYAKWIEILYQVYFANVDISPIAVKANEKISRPKDPTLLGYTFVGWYKEKECLNPWNFDSDIVTAITTLFPKWEKEEDAKPVSCCIRFESNGGSLVKEITTLTGNRIESPATPTKEGFIFDGWYKEKECLNSWNFQTDIVNEDITLYAKWIMQTLPTIEESSLSLAALLSVSISVAVGVLGICFLGIIYVRKKRSK